MLRFAKLSWAAIALMTLVSASTAQAQILAPQYLNYPYGAYSTPTANPNASPYNPYGFGFGTGIYGGGTAAGNYLQGAAAVIESRGRALSDSSQAAINYESAWGKELENRSAFVRTYFENLKLNHDYRNAMREPKATHEQLVRWAKEGNPGRTKPDDLDQASGIILWPSALMSSEFDHMRTEMERLYGERTGTNYGPSSPIYGSVQQVAAMMREVLKEQIPYLDATEYLVAKKMIDRLAYEARFAPAAPNVATR